MSPCYRPGRWRVWHQKQKPRRRVSYGAASARRVYIAQQLVRYQRAMGAHVR